MNAHGIMFHHFHDENHPAGQGSLSADDFHRMLQWLTTNYRILQAEDFYLRALSGDLDDKDTCLTFDDSLLCQFDIAAPVLADHGLTAYFFVYSSAFSESPDMLEVYRFFRSTEYQDFEAFCLEFMDEAASQHEELLSTSLQGFNPESYLADCDFYSTSDRLFRYVRDRLLTAAQYADVMNALMRSRSFNVEDALPKLFMDEEDLVGLRDRGNIVGLHSHSHPLVMESLSRDEQRLEYTLNADFLQSVLGESPFAMSHPMGRYNSNTLQVLRELGVKLGFRASRSVTAAASLLEIPREDHANVMKRML